jgi:hypothetical protein
MTSRGVPDVDVLRSLSTVAGLANVKDAGVQVTRSSECKCDVGVAVQWEPVMGVHGAVV